MASESIRIKVKRQRDPESRPHWEGFEIPRQDNMNVISLFMEIQKHPVTSKGDKTTPVTWEQNCLEEICGACTMLINGKVRQACTALVDQIPQPISIEPMTTFPVVRDLIVDRSIMFDTLKQVKAWIPIDGTYALGPGPRESDRERQLRYEMSKCFSCGACLEACPNYHADGGFVGPQALNQVRLFNLHPTGKLNKGERLETVMGSDGVTECGNSQNCVQVCPKGIPLTTSIAVVNRDTTIHGLKRWLAGDSANTTE